MRNLCWTFTPSSALSLLFLLLSFPLALELSPEWAKENGPLEWTQIFLLATAGIVAVAAYFNGTGDVAFRKLFLCSVPVWITLIGREMSWGRVFYPNGSGGYLSLKQLWYGPYVFPCIAAVLAFVVFFMVKNGLQNELVHWLKNGRFPAIDGFVFILAAIAAELFEHRMASLFGSRHVVFEEVAEMVAYFSLLSLTVNLGFHSAYQRANWPSRMKRAPARDL